MKYFASTSPEISEAEEKHSRLIRDLAGECVVLLENNGVLPIKNKGNIALLQHC